LALLLTPLPLVLMSAIIADDGYLLPFFLSLLSIIDLVNAPCVCLVLFDELDAAGHTDALEIPLLLSSDGVAANIELD
jgi:hypothetical protein